MDNFAIWVHETAPKQLILRIDANQYPGGNDGIDVGLIGHFQDDDGWDFGHYRFRLGFGDGRDKISYYSWRRVHNHGKWFEHAATVRWPRAWRQAKPVMCRVRSTYSGAITRGEKLPDWATINPNCRTTMQYVQQVRGLVRSLRYESRGPVDPFVHRWTDDRLAAIVHNGNRELDHLVA